MQQVIIWPPPLRLTMLNTLWLDGLNSHYNVLKLKTATTAKTPSRWKAVFSTLDYGIGYVFDNIFLEGN